MVFRNGVAAGTFDHLHPGHKHYLDYAIKRSECLSIGLTSDCYVQKSEKELKELIQPYDERKAAIEEYLEEGGCLERARVFGIEDEFGDTLANNSYDAVFVSDETGRKNAEKINECREAKGMSKLEIVGVPALLGQDGERFSSTKIRRSNSLKSG